jgi:hypothetical protein
MLGGRFLGMESDNFEVAVQAVNALWRNELVLALIDVPISGPRIEAEIFGRRTLLPAGHGVWRHISLGTQRSGSGRGTGSSGSRPG